jgi:hypothetical protein
MLASYSIVGKLSDKQVSHNMLRFVGQYGVIHFAILKVVAARVSEVGFATVDTAVVC